MTLNLGTDRQSAVMTVNLGSDSQSAILTVNLGTDRLRPDFTQQLELRLTSSCFILS